MKSICRLFMVAVLLFSSIACDDDEEEIPPYSETGANTFAAYINGQLWTPKGKPTLWGSNYDLTYDHNYGNHLFLGVYRGTTASETLHIHINGADHLGRYNLSDPKVGNVTFYTDHCEYQREDKLEGWLEITKLDFKNYIISGKFEFTKSSASGCETIVMTQGRFDKKL